MSPLAGLFSRLKAGIRQGGTTRLLLGFVIGALFALVPMHYFYMGREAALRAVGYSHETSPVPGTESARSPIESSSPAKAFASRLTYELRNLPEERQPPASRVTPPAAPLASAAPAPQAQAAPAPGLPPATERVVNSRPISTVPPEPRDRTREIEKEAQQAEYREGSRKQQQAKAPAVTPRVIEGREIDILEAERVGGVSPIKPPAKKGEAFAAGRTTVAKALPSGGGEAPASGPMATGSEADVESRLEASRDWLAAAPPTTHTIQLMGATSEEQLKGHLRSLSKVIEPGKLYIFRTKAHGKPSITVVYGTYGDRQSALQALEKLPPSVAANKPVLRTVNGIRSEMKQNNTDG